MESLKQTVKQFLKRGFANPLRIEATPVMFNYTMCFDKVHLTIWFVDNTKWEEDASWFDLDYLIHTFYKKYFESIIDDTFFDVLENIKTKYLEQTVPFFKEKKEQAKILYQERAEILEKINETRKHRNELEERERIILHEKNLFEGFRKFTIDFEQRQAKEQIDKEIKPFIFLNSRSSENFRPMCEF